MCQYTMCFKQSCFLTCLSNRGGKGGTFWPCYAAIIFYTVNDWIWGQHMNCWTWRCGVGQHFHLLVNCKLFIFCPLLMSMTVWYKRYSTKHQGLKNLKVSYTFKRTNLNFLPFFFSIVHDVSVGTIQISCRAKHCYRKIQPKSCHKYKCKST